MQTVSKVYIIGIGYKPFDKKAHEAINRADVILASRRLLEVFERYDEFETVRDKVRVLSNIEETIAYMRDRYKEETIVLLASGDPLFSGIGRRVINELGKGAVEIFPELSSIQVAFSKIKEAWDDAFLMSLHGGPDPEKRRRLPYEITDIPFLLQSHNKIAILTDRENNPAAIAKEIVQSSSFLLHPSSFTMYVCERLGYPEEKVTEGNPEEIARMSFSEPNVVIIKTRVDIPQSAAGSQYETKQPETEGRGPETGFFFGLAEDDIAHSRGLITKDEARAVTIHKLRLPRCGVFWDIGAGSGSVSIEAARLCPALRVFAVEKDKEQLDNIKRNRVRFNVPNIELIEGPALESLESLPAPDRVFIGGSGGQLEGLVRRIGERMLSGIIVLNAATIETLHDAVHHFEIAGFITEISQVSISRSKIVNGRMHMSALNPVFIITGRKN